MEPNAINVANMAMTRSGCRPAGTLACSERTASRANVGVDIVSSRSKNALFDCYLMHRCMAD
ncbi:hypothetical protein [Sphingobium yanoikuyae]|uniref:hypothetical protein n=1 Tax=Sphingobium yanoikuyae TaxID=13690 RepID=UPI0028B0C888|nr:hypothetical protein [Sphingobium yanoikuyae]